MKIRRLIILMGSIGLVFGLMSGCGGGGSGSGENGNVPAKPAAGLDDQKVNKNATQLAETLGCNYSAAVAVKNKKANLGLSYKTVDKVRNIIVREDVLDRMVEASKSAKKDSSTKAGECGGTVDTVKDTINDTEGITDLTFHHYCTTKAADINTTLNGSVHIENATEDDDNTTSLIKVSTPTPINIKTINPNTKEKMDTTIDLQGAKAVVNTNGNKEMTSIHITAVTIKFTDNMIKQSCTATDVIIDMDDSNKTTFSANISCEGTDTGIVKVNGKVNKVNSENAVGSIEVTDANGRKETLISTGTKGVFDVSFDGRKLGKMDCSMIDMPALSE